MVRRNSERYEWEDQTCASTDFAGEAEEDIGEDSNWKVPGPDGVQGFWLKNFTSLHKNHLWQLNAWLEGETKRLDE